LAALVAAVGGAMDGEPNFTLPTSDPNYKEAMASPARQDLD
jgi:hypothetical protein